MKPTSERRAAPRVQMDFPGKLTLPDGTSDARIRNISVSGISCVTDRALPVMTQVELIILLPIAGSPVPIHCAGAVVRSSPLEAHADQFETAIFFTELGEEARNELEDFVVLHSAA